MATLTPEQLQQFAGQRLGFQEDAERARRRIQEDYDLQVRLANEQSSRDQTQVADQIASQGLYNSGIRINEQGQVVRRANEAISQYGLGRSRGLEDVGAGLTRNLAGVDERERSALAEAARIEREEAIQRALLEAQRQAPVIQPPPMPNPVIPYTPPPPPPMPAPTFDPYAAYLAKIKADAQAGYLISQQTGATRSGGSTSYPVPKIEFNPATGAPYRTPMNPRIIQRY